MKDLGLEEFFKVSLEKQKEESEERIYRKASEKFIGNYAVVKAYSKDLKYANCIWYGVINQDYETVIPFRLWDKIELLGEHVLIQETRRDKNSSFLEKQTLHVKLDENQVHYVNTIGRYQKINEKIIVTENEEGLVYLYDLSIGKQISSLFTEIGTFEEIDGELVAFAKKKFPLEDIYRIPMEMKCYIDLNGDPWSETHIPFLNRSCYLTKKQFDFCYQQFLDDIRYEQAFEKRDPVKVAKKLRKKAKPL